MVENFYEQYLSGFTQNMHTCSFSHSEEHNPAPQLTRAASMVHNPLSLCPQYIYWPLLENDSMVFVTCEDTKV